MWWATIRSIIVSWLVTLPMAAPAASAISQML